MMKVHHVTYSAIHEAAHAYAALLASGGPILVHRSTGKRQGEDAPGISFWPQRMELYDIVFTLLAGMAAERRAREEFGDPAPLDAIIEAGRDDLDFLANLGIEIPDLERALRLVEEDQAENWQDLLRLAVHIQRAWDEGIEEFEIGEDDLLQILQHGADRMKAQGNGEG